MAEALLTREAMRRFVTVEEIADDTLDDMIDDVSSTALALAPCLADDDLSEVHAKAAIAVLRGAVLRWVEYRTGEAVTTQAGPFSETVASPERRRGDLLWPTEIRQLQEICGRHQGESRRQAFTLSRFDGSAASSHPLICSVYYGGRCSCGVALTGDGPLWGE